MEKPIDVRTLDEWMYALQSILQDLEAERPVDASEHGALMQQLLDDMRERRAHLRLRRHNELGY